MSAILAAALDYARRLGWPVHPLRPGTKRPITEHGFHDATCDLEQIRAWWRKEPNANIGSPLRDDLVVIDEDEPGALRAVVANLGPLPSTAEQRTRDGGRHLFYRLPDDRRLRHAFPLVGGVTPDKPAVEIRCGGKGYVLLPPSRVPAEIEGGPGVYSWIVKPTAGTIIEAPEWLFSSAQARKGREPAEWNELAEKVIPKGARNDTLASVAGLLFRRLPPGLAYDLGLLWAQHRTSPRMKEREARRTLESIALRELKRRTGGAS